MVIQLVKLSIKPEQRDKWLELARANAAETRGVEGCEGVQVCEDIETPNTFTLVERWSNLEARYDQFRSPKFGELMSQLEEVLAAPPEASINEVSSTQTLDEALAAAGVSD